MRRVLIDADMGVDDAVALMIALKAPEVRVEAVTTVYGNIDVGTASRNASFILSKFEEQPHCALYQGATSPLLTTKVPEQWPGHGANGLGGMELDVSDEELLKRLSKEHAVTALIRLAAASPGELDLIALGPLTNIALALQLDPSFITHLRSMSIMGGTHSAKGNVTKTAEFNFHCDPEAAAIVLAACEEASTPALVVPWETTDECGLEWHDFDRLFTLPSPTAMLFNRMWFTAATLLRERASRCAICDAYCVLALFHPEIIAASEKLHGSIELHGTLTRGMLVLDWGPDTLSKNVHLVTGVRTDKVIQLLEGFF